MKKSFKNKGFRRPTPIGSIVGMFGGLSLPPTPAASPVVSNKKHPRRPTPIGPIFGTFGGY